MELHNLKFNAGSIKKSKRIGRGQGSAKGGTSTKGHKGAKSRSGYKTKIGFEGGQMPIQRRLPKFGFKHYKKYSYKLVNIDIIQKLINLENNVHVVDLDFFKKHGLIKANSKVKVLGKGKLTSKLKVYAHAFSKSASKLINDLGGQANIL